MKITQFEFNTILRWANGVVAALTLYAFIIVHGNAYIDRLTIVLAILLCFQTHLALRLERRRRDPFALLLAFLMVFYFSFRIFTLAIYHQPYSNVFNRFLYESVDSNRALAFILVANCFLYLGLYVVKLPRDPSIPSAGWRGTSPQRISVLLILLITAAYARLLLPPTALPRFFSLFDVVIDQNFVIVLAIAYYLLFRRSLGRRFVVILAGLIAIEVLLHTFVAASRGAIVVLLESFGIVLLALHGSIRVRGSIAAGSFVALPMVALIAIGSFTVATALRVFTLQSSQHLGTSLQEAANDAAAKRGSWDEILQPIFDRAGYFDYSAELIAHRREYSTVINLPAYYRSIVDNVLTPGFDIYDQARISYSLRFVYFNLGQPAKSLVAADYQSDQLGIYGEYFVLFGWASLPLFFFTAFLIKLCYSRLKAGNPFVLAVKRIILLLSFNVIVNSYGFDWTIYTVISYAASAFVYQAFFLCSPGGGVFASRGSPRGWREGRTLAARA